MLPLPPHSRQSSHASIRQSRHQPSRTFSHYSVASTGIEEGQDEEREDDGIEMVAAEGGGRSALGMEGETDEAEDEFQVYGSGTIPHDPSNTLENGPPPLSSRNIETTLNLLGFGPYQHRLLILCGLGWTSDNATLQSLALILPRVAYHFSLTPTRASLLSASTMAGMMIGSIGWGSLSDVMGRKAPFNLTLGLTGVFNLAGAWVGGFGGLCLVMGCVGSAVGGSMPTDGTLFLENLPEQKQYLLTLLSIFFSLGAVLSSVVGYLALPGRSCFPEAEVVGPDGIGNEDMDVGQRSVGCDIEAGDNDGWRRVLLVLGVINLSMFALRFLLFKLHESPRYLVSNNRSQEALEVVRAIALFNGLDLTLEMEDVRPREEDEDVMVRGPRRVLSMYDGQEGKGKQEEGVVEPLLPEPNRSFGGLGVGRPPRVRGDRSGTSTSTPSPNRRMNSSTPLDVRMIASTYVAMPQTPGISEEMVGREDYFSAPVVAQPSDPDIATDQDAVPRGYTNTHHTADAGGKLFAPAHTAPTHPHLPRLRQTKSFKSFREIKDDGKSSLDEWLDRMKALFEPKWKRTTVLMWAIWGLMSLGYTMFNVWLPTVLETKSTGTAAEGLNQALFEMVLYAAAGCPGSVIGAYAIESRLGRRKSLAIFTLLTAISTFAFTGVSSSGAVVASSMLISVAATAMYAILYGMTPEIFGIEIRGTACGTSAALSRLTGITAPILAGTLLTISPSLPLFTAAGIFAIAAVCALFLPFEKGQSGPGGGRGGGGMIH